MKTLTKNMKQNTKSSFATNALLASLIFAGNAFGEIYFKADFNDSTAADDENGLEANADIDNLNAGTEVGSWTFTGAAAPSIARGAIVSNPDNSDNAFVFDDGISGGLNRRAAGLFSQPVNIANGDSLNFEFEIFPTRQGASGNRQVRIALTDSSGLSGGGRAYLLILNLSAPGASKEFLWLSSGNDQLSIATQEDIGFQNAAADNYLTWDWADGNPIRVRINVLGLPTITTPGRGLVSIDWNNDGTWDTENFPIGGRDVGVTSIDRFELFYSGFETTPKGAYFDNIVATVEKAEEDPYEVWASDAGLTPPNEGRFDDKDGDGIANILEWVLGTEPLIPSGSDAAFEAERVGNDFVFTFDRVKETLGEVDLILEYSENLTDWTPVGVPADTQGIFTVTDGGDFDVITATIPGTASGQLFARLRAQ